MKRNSKRLPMAKLLAFSLSLLFLASFVLFGSASPAETLMVMAITPVVNIAGACSDILVYLEQIAGQNNPFTMGKKNGALDYITSPQNGGVKAELISTDQGRKLAQARVVYKRRIKACEMVTTPADLCGTCTPEVPKEVKVSLSNYVGTPCFTFSNSDMINICQDTTSFVNEYVLSAMQAGRQKVDEIILAALKSFVGVNYVHDGAPTVAGSCVNVQLLGTANGQKIPLFGNYTGMLLDYANNEMQGTPVIIGDGNLWQFSTLSQLACCNSAIPYESAVATAQAAFYIDMNASKVLGANVVHMTGYNINHLLWFNENHNINIDTPTQKHIVIPDPVNPALAWDMDFEFDACSKSWKWKLGAWVGVFNIIQADAFSSGASPVCDDDRIGMTGNFCYTVTSA
jgi:hypothetical protein